MSVMEWTPEYAIGVASVDRQHQELFRRANAFFEGVATGGDRALLKELLDYLDTYIIEHFQMETALMERHRYPGREAHLQEHRYFTETMATLKEDFAFNFGKSDEAIVSLYHHLAEWFKDHILITDRELGRFLTNPRGPTDASRANRI